MIQLNTVDGLVVSQRKEWGEILIGFEGKNKYAVLDTNGNELYLAVEEGGFFLFRWWLKALRPFTIAIRTLENRPALTVQRPFRFYFHQANISDAQGILLGSVKRRFAIIRRKYSVYDANENEVYQLFGPLLRPWTFFIRKDDEEFGKITKKWSGLLKEGFTDADNFGVTFPAQWDAKAKALFLGAVFLIDFVHFENKSN